MKPGMENLVCWLLLTATHVTEGASLTALDGLQKYLSTASSSSYPSPSDVILKIPPNNVNRIDQDFTLCFSIFIWSRALQYRLMLGDPYWLQIDARGLPKTGTIMRLTVSTLVAPQSSINSDVNITKFPDWKYVCLNLNSVNGSLKLSIDGTILPTKILPNYKQQIPAWNTSPGAALKITNVVGLITNINVFNGAKNLKDILCTSAGNYLAWDNAFFKTGQNSKIISQNEVCKVSTDIFMGLAETMMSYSEADKMCSQMVNVGDSMLTSKSAASAAIDFVMNQIIPSFISGGSAEELNMDPPTNSNSTTTTVPPTTVAMSQQELAYFIKGINMWMKNVNLTEGDDLCTFCNLTNGCGVQPCSEPAFFVCQFTAYPKFVLQGLCGKTSIDIEYYAYFGNNLLYFIGNKGAVMFPDLASGSWKIAKPYTDSSSTAVSTDVFLPDLPTGSNRWNISRDKLCSKFSQIISLGLSPCNSSQFNCWDGGCINIGLRCDNFADCEDGSDEEGCTLLYKKSDVKYNQDIIYADPKNKSKLLDIEVSFETTYFPMIDDINGLFRVRYRINLEWKDVRLNFINLKNYSENKLSDLEFDAIWKPTLIYENRDLYKYYENIGPNIFILGNSFVGTPSPKTDANNALVYDGSINNLKYFMDVSSTFECPFDMGDYPFDVQQCYLVLILPGNSLRLTLKELKMGKYADVTPYKIVKYRMCKDGAYVWVQFIMDRSILNFIMMVAFPTILCNIIAYAANFAPVDNFDGVIGVDITILLVIATMFLDISSRLPPSTGVKLVEIWMMASLVLPFLDILLFIFMRSRVFQKEREKNMENTTSVEDFTKPPESLTMITDKEEQDKMGAMSKSAKYQWFFDKIFLTSAIEIVEHEVEETDKYIQYCKLFLFKIEPVIFFLFCFVFMVYGVCVKMQTTSAALALKDTCIEPVN